MKWLILVLGIASNASASILLKVAVTPPRQFPSPRHIVEALQNWPFWLGLALYGVSFLLYAMALSKFPLNVAHPILTSGAIAVVATASLFLFREPFSITTGLGILFVILGVGLITARAT